jgi:hypothetical protein
VGSFAAIVLVCLASVSREACDESTAVEVRSIRVESELACATGWQEIIVRTGGEHGVGSATYLKTLCRRVAAGSDSRR